MKILIADDHPIIHVALGEMLKSAFGATLQRMETVSDSDALLARLPGEACDVLVLDLFMPGAIGSIPLLQRVVATRPQRENEMALGCRKCVSVIDRTAVQLHTKPVPTCFTFDHALAETGGQEEVFALVGKPITDRCLEGYNGTILAYGQVRTSS